LRFWRRLSIHSYGFVIDNIPLAARIEQAYATAGYVLARVVVPAQDLTDNGTVRLVVIDGVIERVDVNAVPERLRNIVSSRMASLVGEPHVTLDEIERRLLLVGNLPGLQLRSTLAAGMMPGGTLLIVEAAQNYVTGSIGVDDRLPGSLGTWAINTNVAANDALGLGEQVYVSYSPSLNSGTTRLQFAGGGLVVPIGSDGFTVNPEYTNSLARPIPEPGTPATRGDFQRFAFHAAWPLILTRDEMLTLQATGEWDAENLIATQFDTRLYDDNYGVARLDAHDTQVLPGGDLLVFDGSLSHGLGGRDGTAAEPLSQQGARPDFTKFNAFIALRQPLTNSFEIDLTGRAQTSFGSSLMLAEQFSLDGPDALSSFAAGTFNVDQGVSLRFELARPFVLLPLPLNVAPYLFGSYGYGQIVSPTTVQQPFINAGSAGVGVRSNNAFVPAGLPVGSSFSVELGRQITDVSGQRAGYRVNASFTLKF